MERTELIALMAASILPGYMREGRYLAKDREKALDDAVNLLWRVEERYGSTLGGNDVG